MSVGNGGLKTGRRRQKKMGKKISKKAIAVGIVAVMLIVVGIVSAQNDFNSKVKQGASIELESSDDIIKDLVVLQLNAGMGMGVSPASFKKELSPDEVQRENLTIFNAGDDVLNFEIQIDYVEQQTDWLSVFPKNGTINPRNKTRINVTFNTTGLASGEYHANITVIGNEVLKLPVRVHLTVRQVALIFDTGKSENPYPSIMGTHNGTINPNQTITVSKLYTYPCLGTGGHTEFAMIWNETIGDCAVAEWNGYIDDYHAISFNKTLTLEKGVIYNYTIRTGSYPQIHHTDNHSTSAGFITCSEFTDANGKRYVNWIPALRLE